VAIIIAPSHVNALRGATMDFVEIEPGQHRFIFLNPNDPEYSPPTGG
jgi:iron-sulfur cluster assembly protein